MAKLSAYDLVTEIDSDDFIILDGTGGTRRITITNLALLLPALISTVGRRNIFRGKYLGSSITSAQKSAISAGTFDGMFIGDYWTINGINWRIVDMDYFYRTGDTNFATHHLVLMPDTVLYSASMNSTNTTEGGYAGSEMYLTGLDEAKEIVNEAFGDLVLTHREYLSNAITDGHPSGGAWFDSTVELPDETMYYGSAIRQAMGDGSFVCFNHTIGKQQLALFSLYPRWLHIRSTVWLRNVVSATYFAIAYYYGSAHSNYASHSYGVRPYFCIGG